MDKDSARNAQVKNVSIEHFVAPTNETMDRIEASSPRIVVRRGDSYDVIHGPPVQPIPEFCKSTAQHLRDEAKRNPREAQQLETLATVYDRRGAR